MGDTNLSAALGGSLATAQADITIDPKQLDSQLGVGETEWSDDQWTQHLGYYKKIPELKTVIDIKSKWTLGKGYEADEETSLILGNIRGWGKETFCSILQNMDRTRQISKIGAFAEIITNDDGILINLKPLDPGSITIIVDNKGRIKRYEQRSKIDGKIGIKKFKPEQIFHLTEDRLGDEIHSTCAIEALEETILIINEATKDWRKVLHRNVAPLKVHYLDTDDPSKIAAYKAKQEEASANFENMYVPMGSTKIEVLGVAPNATLNPLPWIEFQLRKFFQLCGVPDIITGTSATLTEASAKIAYLGWQQTVEDRQYYLEEEILAQLNLVVELVFPASLDREALSGYPQQGMDQGYDINAPEIQDQAPAFEPNDMEAGLAGRQ